MLDEFIILLLIQLENILNYHLDWIIGIHFEASDYLRLKMEVLAQHEVFANIEFWFLKYFFFHRIILNQHVDNWAFELFGHNSII
jgi:hypothetical protein